MTIVKNGYPCSDWEWRCLFIKLSNKIGENKNPTVDQIRDITECEDHLLMKYKINKYPLKHYVGKKEYLFYHTEALRTLHFKTYEGEPYLDKYGRWHRKANLL